MIFTLNFIYQRHHHRLDLRNLYSLKSPYLQKYADAVAEKGASLHTCLDFVGGTIACICILVLNERVAYSHDTRVNGVKFQTVVLPNGLIIKLEGKWEKSGLCFHMGTMLNRSVHICRLLTAKETYLETKGFIAKT